MNFNDREFRLYPRRPRSVRSDGPRVWSIAFKQVLYFARMSRKATRSTSPASSSRPRKPYRQRCAVRVTYSQNKTRGQWKAHGRYLMREAATGNVQNQGAFNQVEPVKNLMATLEEWQKSGDQRMFKFIISPEFGDRVDLERLTRDLMARMERDLAGSGLAFQHGTSSCALGFARKTSRRFSSLFGAGVCEARNSYSGRGLVYPTTRLSHVTGC